MRFKKNPTSSKNFSWTRTWGVWIVSYL